MQHSMEQACGFTSVKPQYVTQSLLYFAVRLVVIPLLKYGNTLSATGKIEERARLNLSFRSALVSH